MSEAVKLEIALAYPLILEATEKPSYEMVEADAASLRGSYLDLAVAVSHLDEGILYLYFSIGGPLESLSYEPVRGRKVVWNPSADAELSARVLNQHERKTGEKLSNLNLLVKNVLGAKVELPRLKRSKARSD